MKTITMDFNDTSVVIGRFQVHELHEGHLYVLDQANEHKKMLVLIGIAPTTPNAMNPLDYPTRERMIKASYPDAIVLPLPDQPTNSVWGENVDSLIRTVCPMDSVVMYGGRDSFADHYLGQYPVIVTKHHSLPVTGTTIRQRVGKEVSGHPEFRRGVIYATQNIRPRLYATVDIAVFKYTQEGWSVLLGWKKNMPNLWRFPGGFVDMRDKNLEAAARRELNEETSISVEGPLHLVGTYRVKDWRDQPPDGIMTAFFVGEYTFGSAASAGDDLDTLAWFGPLEVINKKIKFADDHEKLFDELLTFMTGRNPFEVEGA